MAFAWAISSPESPCLGGSCAKSATRVKRMPARSMAEPPLYHGLDTSGALVLGRRIVLRGTLARTDGFLTSGLGRRRRIAGGAPADVGLLGGLHFVQALDRHR